MENEFLPRRVRIEETKMMTSLEKWFKLDAQLDFKPGQFLEISVAGAGEAPISICSWNGVEICVRKVGRVSSALHQREKGDFIGIRGPYGNGFPMKEIEGEKLILVAGGLGMAPLRSVLQYVLKNRKKYGEVTFFYGIKCLEMMLFRDELLKLMEEENVNLHIAYEIEDEEIRNLKKRFPERFHKGMVTTLFEKVKVNTESFVVVCGPPIMYKFVLKKMEELGFYKERIYMTLERRMKCGTGKCRHCVVGIGSSSKLICRDGPVFSAIDAELIRELV
jgi:sulfhydrogenase subunit gamma (sulfur reductase)